MITSLGGFIESISLTSELIEAWLKPDNELARRESGIKDEYLDAIKVANVELKGTTSIGSGVFAIKPGDGSAREQAASCQRVLGGVCNISREYATKRYRSNLINWGMLPFINKGLRDIILVVNEENKYIISKCNKYTLTLNLIVQDGTWKLGEDKWNI